MDKCLFKICTTWVPITVNAGNTQINNYYSPPAAYQTHSFATGSGYPVGYTYAPAALLPQHPPAFAAGAFGAGVCCGSPYPAAANQQNQISFRPSTKAPTSCQPPKKKRLKPCEIIADGTLWKIELAKEVGIGEGFILRDDGRA